MRLIATPVVYKYDWIWGFNASEHRHFTMICYVKATSATHLASNKIYIYVFWTLINQQPKTRFLHVHTKLYIALFFPITHIVNITSETGIFPTDIKCVKGVPNYKAGDPS